MSATPPSLALLTDDVITKIFILRKPTTLIGRGKGSDICIDQFGVSKRHACLRIEPSEYFPNQFEIYLEDLGSKNGTRVNDEEIVCHRLQPNDLISIAWTRFKFIDSLGEREDTTAFILLD